MSNTFLRNKKHLLLSIWLLFGIHSGLQACQSSAEETDPAPTTQVEVPQSMVFCNEVIDLSRFDRRERLDRELLAFTYMHSTSIQMIKRANRYFPVIERILQDQGVPDDFKYLMVIESSVNPLARSGAGAAGCGSSCPPPPANSDWRSTTMWTNATT